MGVKEFKHLVTFGKDRYHQLDDMAQWCHDHFGWVNLSFNTGDDVRDGIWKFSTAFGNLYFYFESEQDALLFSLRWA